jgi:hypothetical protein
MNLPNYPSLCTFTLALQLHQDVAYAVSMTVVRSSMFTDWDGVVYPRRLLIDALNKVARVAITDLDSTVLPFCRENAHLVFSGGSLRVQMMDLVRDWAAKHYLVEDWATDYLRPPSWLSESINLTLRAWLTTDVRLLLLPEGRVAFSIIQDLMYESQTDVLNLMRDYVTMYESGELPEAELLRLYGKISMDQLSAAMRHCEAEVRESTNWEILGPPQPPFRLSFTPGHAEAVVRYQVLGQSVDEITGGGRARRRGESTADLPLDADPANLRKTIKEFLRAVEIEPRRRRISKR